jgi:hypothetical protein
MMLLGDVENAREQRRRQALPDGGIYRSAKIRTAARRKWLQVASSLSRLLHFRDFFTFATRHCAAVSGAAGAVADGVNASAPSIVQWEIFAAALSDDVVSHGTRRRAPRQDAPRWTRRESGWRVGTIFRSTVPTAPTVMTASNTQKQRKTLGASRPDCRGCFFQFTTRGFSRHRSQPPRDVWTCGFRVLAAE